MAEVQNLSESIMRFWDVWIQTVKWTESSFRSLQNWPNCIWEGKLFAMQEKIILFKSYSVRPFLRGSSNYLKMAGLNLTMHEPYIRLLNLSKSNMWKNTLI